MSAHPAGPRHAEIPHAPNLPERPSDPKQMIDLPANVWPRNAVRDEDGILRLAGVPGGCVPPPPGPGGGWGRPAR